MARVAVTLNQNTSIGVQVAAWQDAANQIHQLVAIETQTGAADPVPVGATNPLPVQSSAANPVVVNGNVAAGSADSGAGIKISGVFNTAPPTYANGQRADFQSDVNGNLCVNIKAGAAAGGTSSTFAAAFPGTGTAMGALNSAGTLMQPMNLDASGNLKITIASGGVPAQQDNAAFTGGSSVGLGFMATFNDSITNLSTGNAGALRCTLNRALYAAPAGAVSGGATPFTYVNVSASNNATRIKSTPGQVYAIQVVNISGVIGYLKLYDRGSAAPVPGTDTPIFNLPIPANTSAAGVALQVPVGMVFANGIGFAITQGIALNDNTAYATAAQIALNVQYN